MDMQAGPLDSLLAGINRKSGTPPILLEIISDREQPEPD